MRRAIGLSLALWAISGIAIAKPTLGAEDPQHQPQSVKPKAAKDEHPAARHAAGRERRVAAAESTPRHAAAQHRSGSIRAAPEDRAAGPAQSPAAIKVVGQREIGMAAWYGGHHIGRRTANGAVLDSVTPTAAHRSLPLNSQVRITNLNNGHSVICTINDRGPWGHNRLIDVSPRAADELDMKRSGIARVSVEPVAAVAHSGSN
jgi:rare lipoprotein A (peptidoglycan hydrolase)